MTRTIIYAIVLNADKYDEGLTFNEASGSDNVIHAFYDYETNKCVYAGDTYHSSPRKFFEGLKAGIYLCGGKIDVVEALVFLNDDEEDGNFIDVSTAIRRYIKENDL